MGRFERLVSRPREKRFDGNCSRFWIRWLVLFVLGELLDY